MATRRDDYDAIARLLTASGAEELLGVAVFCAQFAATTCQQRQQHSPSGDMDAARRVVALQLAGQPTPY